MIDRFQYLLHELDQGLDRYDFTVDEDIEITRENASWPKTDDESGEGSA